MSDYPPYENNNPYTPPTQYPPQSGYSSPNQYMQQPVYQTPMYVQPQYMAAVPVVPINDPGSGQALAGMILGICGLFFFTTALVPLLGLIFSILGMKSITRKGMAVAGLVMSILGLIGTIIFFWIIIAAIIAASTIPSYPTY